MAIIKGKDLMLRFILLFLFLFTVSISLAHSNFVEYKERIVFYPSRKLLCDLLIQCVTNVESSSFTYKDILIELNDSVAVNSTMTDVLLNPQTFYLINGVGNTTLYRDPLLILENQSRDCFTYVGYFNLSVGVKIKEIVFVNSTGVPTNIIELQLASNGTVVSEIHMHLIASNIVDPEEKPIVPPHIFYATHKLISLSYIKFKIKEYTILAGLIGILVILLLRDRKK
ncbi:hypothetical protein HS7_00030 [Sulfolobales archaeon HS-7]|nr:hypothetical protein HS7_00030 [Sulfolobales archaeon HS-7]